MDVMRIRGTGTGFLAGGQSFVTGFYDGISGLVMEPIKGARNGGVRVTFARARLVDRLD